MQTKLLIILTGYTGIGKTDLSIQLAKKINAEIISCDSLLVYQNMNIGTAKPSAAELHEVPHHCINLVKPDQKFDVQQYIFHAKKAINDITSRGKNVLIVGGTGFYLKSFFYPVIDNIETTSEAENFINEALKNNDTEILVNKLLEINNGEVPIDLKNTRRVISTLKRCLSSGLTCEQMRKNFQQQKCEFSDYAKYTILLTRDDDDLKTRIYKRIKVMLENGLIEEVRNLLANNNFNNVNRTAIGYRETIEYLSNETDISTLQAAIYQDTLKLVKKQKTWFKKQIPIDLSYNMSGQNIEQIAQELTFVISNELKYPSLPV